MEPSFEPSGLTCKAASSTLVWLRCRADQYMNAGLCGLHD